MIDKKLVIAIIATALVGSSGGFYGGMTYQKSKNNNLISFGNNGSPMLYRGNGPVNQNGRQGVRMGMKPVGGEILENDGKTIVIKSTDGSSKIIFISENTDINKAQKVAITELATGQQVTILGTENSDGSVTALNIQLVNAPNSL